MIDIGTHALDITLWCMDNYKPVSVMGSVFEKLDILNCEQGKARLDPGILRHMRSKTLLFGYIKFENGATIFLESAWAINMKDSREAAGTLRYERRCRDRRSNVRRRRFKRQGV